MKVIVIGASGYSGGELLRLLEGHPEFHLHAAIAHTQAGESISSVHPQLAGSHLGRFEKLSDHFIQEAELIFFALPHGESGKIISESPELFAAKKVVDVGADFRLHSSASWEKYYGGTHHGTWQYGLPELPGRRSAIKQSAKIANPGCYATALALSLAPFAQLLTKVNFADVVITAASGTTGAGRRATVNLLGSEVMNSLSAYKVGGIHQHTPEIEEAISALAKKQVRLSITPILAPMPRGILSSVSIPITNASIEEIRDIFSSAYNQEKFVNLLPEGQWPETQSLYGSNGVHIQVALDHHVGRAVVIAALDNLGKGAAGQAIQNANLITGIEESTGLTPVGVR
jgi:N-acetyl-gamma-glutamyl-phosphate reductase